MWKLSQDEFSIEIRVKQCSELPIQMGSADYHVESWNLLKSWFESFVMFKAVFVIDDNVFDNFW